MEKVILGRTGLLVSRIGMGGIPIIPLPVDEAVAIVKEALRLGVNFIDSANRYRNSEEKIGLAIQGIPRDEIVLATKSGAFDKQTFNEHLEKSLRSLGVDYIDIYQLHNVTAKNREEIFAPGGSCEGLIEAVQAGKVRYPGFSCHNCVLAVEIMKENRFDVVQLPFNYVDTEALSVAIPLARKLNMGFIAMKPMGGGMLDDAGLAFRYLLQFDGIVPDPGIDRIEDIQEIVAIVEADMPLTREDQDEIERIREELKETWCHRCNYCLPCSQNVTITSILSIKSYFKRYGVAGSDKKLADAEQSIKRCLGCRECVSRCPYNLDIPRLLVENVEYWRQALKSNNSG